MQQMCARLLGCSQYLTPRPRACSALLVVVIEVVFVVIVVVIIVVIAIESSQRDTSSPCQLPLVVVFTVFAVVVTVVIVSAHACQHRTRQNYCAGILRPAAAG